METNKTQDKKTNPQEKIAKGLKLIIEGCLDGASDLNNDLKKIKRREPMIEDVIKGLLSNAEAYLREAKHNSYFPDLDNITLTSRYKSIKQDFDRSIT